MKRVVVLGSGGQLGTDLRRELKSDTWELYPIPHAELDLRNWPSVAETLNSLAPDVVVNSAAATNVELYEDDMDHAFSVNCHAVRNLSLVCEALKARLFHLSTDYVFGGTKGTPYLEDDALGPLSVYGASKAAGEYFVAGLCSKYAIIRSSALFGIAGVSGKGGNFVETMLRLGLERREVTVVTDQVTCPTYTRDLAQMVRRLIDIDAQGTFHVTNGGECSWHEFAVAIFEAANLRVDVRPITTTEFGARAPRPAYSVLENRRLLDRGFPSLRHWREALGAYMEARERSAVGIG